VFRFVPPAGATVTQQHLGGQHAAPPGKAGRRAPAVVGAPRPTTLGSGWTQVVELPVGGALTGRNAQLLNRLSTAVPGGRLITTALVSVLITDDGHLFAGPVSGAALQRVAATGHGL
jgi:hypothetical protein